MQIEITGCESHHSRAMNDYVTVGNRIKILRRVLKLNQRTFAVSINCLASTLSMIEKGRRGLPRDLALRIKKRWGIDPTWLWEGDAGRLPHHLARELVALEKDNTAQSA